MSAATTQKYFTVACCDGVAAQRPKGSISGVSRSSSSLRRAAYHHAIAEMPASNMMMLTPVQTTVSPLGRLATNGSYGQLLVYVMRSPGRLVVAAQDVQKKKAHNF